jgi:hypothetical protein
MLDGIDVAPLAARFDINETTARDGMLTIIPSLMDFLKNYGGTLASNVMSGLNGNSGGLAKVAKGFLR